MELCLVSYSIYVRLKYHETWVCQTVQCMLTHLSLCLFPTSSAVIIVGMKDGRRDVLERN